MNLTGIIGLVFVGGGIGSVARYWVGEIALKYYKGNFPIGTLTSNFLACLILGLCVYFFKDKLNSSEWIKYLVLVGFCGGFSTFSTFSVETVKLFQDQFYMLGIANILISLILGIGILLALVK